MKWPRWRSKVEGDPKIRAIAYDEPGDPPYSIYVVKIPGRGRQPVAKVPKDVFEARYERDAGTQ